MVVIITQTLNRLHVKLLMKITLPQWISQWLWKVFTRESLDKIPCPRATSRIDKLPVEMVSRPSRCVLTLRTAFSLTAKPPAMPVGGPQLDGGMKGLLAWLKWFTWKSQQLKTQETRCPSLSPYLSSTLTNTSLMEEREKILFVLSVIVNTFLFLSGDIVVNVITEYNGWRTFSRKRYLSSVITSTFLSLKEALEKELISHL